MQPLDSVSVNDLSCYDICVVGAGMIGSAAAKYIVKQNPGLRVALIGPTEPKVLTGCDIIFHNY